MIKKAYLHGVITRAIIQGAIAYGVISFFLPITFLQASFVGSVVYAIVAITLALPWIRELRKHFHQYWSFLAALLGISSGGFAGILIQLPLETKSLIEPFVLFYGPSSKLQLLKASNGSTILLYFCALLGLFLTIAVDIRVRNAEQLSKSDNTVHNE